MPVGEGVEECGGVRGLMFMFMARRSLLDHPNLVRLYGICLDPLSMVLELCAEGDLNSIIRRHRFNTREERNAARGEEDIALLEDEAEEEEDNEDEERCYYGPIPKELFPWRLRLLIALDIARGMRHLHSLHPPIVHRGTCAAPPFRPFRRQQLTRRRSPNTECICTCPLKQSITKQQLEDQ